MNPKISVVIPTCNRPEYVSRALKSVFSQTLQDFEVIVVDDGVEHRAKDAIKPFELSGKLKYIQNQERKGAPASRNIGIKAAIGELVAFLDDDDEWASTKLEKQSEIMGKLGEEIDFVFCPVRIKFEEAGGKVTEQLVGAKGVYNFFEILLAHELRIITSSLMVKKSVLEEVGGFDEAFPSNQEWDLVIRISKKSKGYQQDEPLVTTHILKEHINSNLERRAAGRKLIIERHFGELVKRPKVLANHYFWLAIFYRDAGRKQEARRYFLKAWLFNKGKIIFLVHFLATFLRK